MNYARLAMLCRKASMMSVLLSGDLAFALAMSAMGAEATTNSSLTVEEIAMPRTPDAFSMALSPDGRRMLYVSAVDGASRLWVRALDNPDSHALPGTEGARFPFWSPDSKSIAFFADGKLKRMEIDGDRPPVPIADAPAGRGGTWSGQDVILFAPSNVVGITRVSASGGATSTLTNLAPGQGSHRWPQWLPGERMFLFTAASPKEEARGVYLASLDGAAPKRILGGETAAVYASGKIFYVTAEGKLVARSFDVNTGTASGEPTVLGQGVASDGIIGASAFAVSNSGVLVYRPGSPDKRQFVWLDRRGTTVGSVGVPDSASPGTPDLAPDGKHLAMSRTIKGNADIWLLSIADGALTQFTDEPSFELGPIWSPDGRRVVFRSNRNGHYDLFEKSLGAAALERTLLVNDQDKGPLDWSRDGRLILFATQNSKVASELWVLPTARNGKAYPLVQNDADNVQGQFSPDGRWLAYSSNQSGRYEIYVRSVKSGEASQQVSADGGSYPRWRPDGRELFYLTRENNLMAVSISAAHARGVLTAGAPVALFKAPVLTGRNQGFGGYNSKATYITTADGRFLMLVSVDSGEAAPPVRVVRGWLTRAVD